jgi:hypothetical protein
MKPTAVTQNTLFARRLAICYFRLIAVPKRYILSWKKSASDYGEKGEGFWR